jgi:excisionase family DNA binding protein
MDNNVVPMLMPYDPDEFWDRMRKIIREEIAKLKGQNSPLMQTPGLTEKPLYKIDEICQLFKVSRTTVHDWMKCGKLRKVKVRSRVFFLGSEIQRLLKGGEG